jgi:hypothetical protein
LFNPQPLLVNWDLPSSFLQKHLLSLLLFLGGSVLFFVVCFFETGSCYVTQAILQLFIHLPLPPKCWDYRYALSLAHNLTSQRSSSHFSSHHTTCSCWCIQYPPRC